MKSNNQKRRERERRENAMFDRAVVQRLAYHKANDPYHVDPDDYETQVDDPADDDEEAYW